VGRSGRPSTYRQSERVPSSPPSAEEVAEIIRQLDESQGVSDDGGRPSADDPEGTPGEYRRVLDQIDQLMRDLRHRSPAEPSEETAPLVSGGLPRSPAPWEEAREFDPEFSPYFQERLVLASGSLSSLGAEVREMGTRWERLQGTVEHLERELGNAAREAAFIRSTDPATTGPPPIELPARAAPSVPPAVSEAPRTTTVEPAPYVRFTAARYNSTIDGLKSRRLRLAVWTLVVAAAISAVLVYVAYTAHEATPPMWLALLPIVWMLPVPFFVLSFLGTQRVLRRNHLNVAGDP
jgi:hypothetical protein